MQFKTNYTNRPVYNGQHVSSISITEKIGYVPIKKQIELLFHQGRLNEMYKASQFQLQDTYNIDDVEIDPTTRKSFSFVEAFGLSQYLKEKFILSVNNKDLNQTNQTTEVQNEVFNDSNTSNNTAPTTDSTVPSV